MVKNSKQKKVKRRPCVPVEIEVVVDDVGHGLRIGGRPRPTAVDVVGDLRQFVRHTVRDVRSETHQQITLPSANLKLRI